MFKSPDSYTKRDWLEANTYGLSQDTQIYRIFRIDYLLEDIKGQKITLVNPCFGTQGDILENPLKEAKYDFENGSYQLFRSLMAEYYSQSWSLEPLSWGIYGQNSDVIRVRARAGDLFDRLMDEEDQFYSLFYHMGVISYKTSKEIRDDISRRDFSEYLDSRGFGLLRTIMRIDSDFENEKEVRLTYIRSPRDDYKTPEKHPVSGDHNQFCAHQFDWTSIINHYEIDPDNQGASDEIEEAIDRVNKTSR